MIRLVSWNIAKRRASVDLLLDMAADVALLQECHRTLLEGDADRNRLDFSPYRPWREERYDRWPMIVRLSDRVRIQWFRQVEPFSSVGEDELSVNGVGIIEAARLCPVDGTPPFIAASIYARWVKPHPITSSRWGVGYQDGSAHGANTDLSAFIGHKDPATHRILAAGDFNTIRGATEDNRLALPARDRTVFDRMNALGLEFLGPRHPHGRQAVPCHTDCQPTPETCPRITRRGSLRRRLRISSTTCSPRGAFTRRFRYGH